MRNLILSTILLFGILPMSKASDRNTKVRPNIIVILVDDMGYSDLGCMGSEIKTPNIDKLANEGVLLTNFYNTSRCCPSRASILTGQFQWDAGIGHMDYTKSTAPEYQGFLNKESITIAEALKQNGYNTFMSGKWHVGNARDQWPDKRGFDSFYGTPEGGGIYFYPSSFYKRDVYENGKQVTADSTWYSTDAFTDAAISYVEKDKRSDNPFFMYLAYIAPHFPLQAKPEDIAKYEGVYEVGYDQIRNQRFNKQKELGLAEKEAELSPSLCPNWSSVEDKKTEARKMQVYAAMIDNLDQNVGRLITVLKERKLYDNTVIMFLSDNGACPSDFNRTPNVQIGSRNSNAAYGIWHNVSNTPFRLGKRKEHEGGIATPLIFSWPNGQLHEGCKITEPAHITDVMPTCLYLSNTTYPNIYEGNKLSDLDGFNFFPLLTGEQQNADRIFYWEHEGNKAIRQGNWKLVKIHKKEWELYNLEDDPYELRNIKSTYPEKVQILLNEYENWAVEHRVQDWPLKKKKKR